MRQINFKSSDNIVERFVRVCRNRRMGQHQLFVRLVQNLDPDYVPHEYRHPSVGDRPGKETRCPKLFSDKDQKRIIIEKKGGLTIDQIAALWGCNRSTIHRVVSRESTYKYPLPVKAPVISVAECDRLRGMVAANPSITLAALSEEFGIGITTARRIINLEGKFSWYGRPKQTNVSASKGDSPRSVKVSGYS